MEEKVRLDIFLYCLTSEGREIGFNQLITSNDGMDAEMYHPNTFWGIGGGLDISINGYVSIFHSVDFHYLVKVTNFLIHSMYWFKGRDCDWFDADEEYPSAVVLRTTASYRLMLEKGIGENLTLSFVPATGEITDERGKRFFRGKVVDGSMWYAAADAALREYFAVMDKVLMDEDPADNTVTVMKRYKEVWVSLR